MIHTISSVLKLFSLSAVVLITSFHQAQADLTHGPLVGHVTDTSANIWARVDKAGEYTIRCSAEKKLGFREDLRTLRTRVILKVEAKAQNDFCIVWKIERLASDFDYNYEILNSKGVVITTGKRMFATLKPIPKKGEKQMQNAMMMFGSCSKDQKMKRQAIWKVLGNQPDVGALVLLGDTPYIDTTDLAVQRRRYREFFSMKDLLTNVRDTPVYATWDDHDFGKNDTNGKLEGKENSRRAFMEYHALASYGDGKNGIYTSFRQGSIEVFLLDTRWFAQTEPSPVDPTKLTLLGKAQWEWLQAGLKASTADVKILACGMIWNGAVRPGKKDHWASYPHERDALFKFIGEKKISGVALIGGDIHRSRIVKHDTVALAGYPIHEFISSPLATNPIKAANQPHPGLIMDLGKPEVILEMSVNEQKTPGMLNARFLGPESKVYHSFSLEISKMNPSSREDDGIDSATSRHTSKAKGLRSRFSENDQVRRIYFGTKGNEAN